MTFKEQIIQGIPKELPRPKSIDDTLNPAPKRKQILNIDEKKLAIKNALRYFPKKWHKELALDFAKELYPHNRSLMGPDIRFSLEKFIDKNPEFEVLNFKTGEIVFDWEIPEEWIIKDAYLQHESGEKFADFKVNNLHLMGYSKPINQIMKKCLKTLINL